MQARQHALVLPPINGGLHCGRISIHPWQFMRAGAPAYQRRAPLRPRAGPVPAVTTAGCSRLSTAGSIAARHRAAAAAGPRSRAPAYQRRAPLRLILDADTNPDIGEVPPPIK